MKKRIIVFLCTAVLISAGVVTSYLKANSANISSNPSSAKLGKTSPSVEICNPMAKYNTLDEARKAMGFNFEAPATLPDGYQMKNVTVINNNMVQIVYLKGDNQISYRTAKGNNDISGDYKTYDIVKTITDIKTEVTLKGKGDSINLATWSKDGVSFSLSFSEGVNEKALSIIIESIK